MRAVVERISDEKRVSHDGIVQAIWAGLTLAEIEALTADEIRARFYFDWRVAR
jgi:hypothetical protein